jgi:hypothetical protein
MFVGYLVDNKVTCYRIFNPHKGILVQSVDVIWLSWMLRLNANVMKQLPILHLSLQATVDYEKRQVTVVVTKTASISEIREADNMTVDSLAKKNDNKRISCKKGWQFSELEERIVCFIDSIHSFCCGCCWLFVAFLHRLSMFWILDMRLPTTNFLCK